MFRHYFVECLLQEDLMQSNTQAVSVAKTTLWADHLIIAWAILYLCVASLLNVFKRELRVEGTVQPAYAEGFLLVLCLLSVLVVCAK